MDGMICIGSGRRVGGGRPMPRDAGDAMVCFMLTAWRSIRESYVPLGDWVRLP